MSTDNKFSWSAASSSPAGWGRKVLGWAMHEVSKTLQEIKEPNSGIFHPLQMREDGWQIG